VTSDPGQLAGPVCAASDTVRWLFADQLGPHFLDAPDQRVLLVESPAVLRRRRFHRQKAYLLLSALRHRAAELGEQAVLVQGATYRQALEQVDGPVSVCAPRSRGADRFVRGLEGVQVLPQRGFTASREQFADWADGRGGRRLLMEDFYREQRVRLGLLVEAGEDGRVRPVGARWNLDAENREPPPRGVATLADAVGLPPPWQAAEDEIDEQVRADLDRMERDDGVEFLGQDGPRWVPVTRTEALAALEHFVATRLPHFGPVEDAMLAADRTLAHSVLSPVMNLGLLDPLEAVRAAEAAYRRGNAPLASVEGYVRQVIGWREYVNGVYWWAPDDYRDRNHLDATVALPDWWWSLDAEGQVEAACLSDVLRDLREDGWVHHIPRLMVLGGYALQRGFSPRELTEWFHQAFLDGYDWVMLANVVGMSQHGDGGLMATKPYTAGGAYIDRMSDYCGGCPFDPRVRTGPTACPYTAGYWWFLARNRDRLVGNRRMGRVLQGLDRLRDLEAVVTQEEARGSAPPARPRAERQEALAW
jgi:deoxyribodipyrimidine photolyase-related protein